MLKILILLLVAAYVLESLLLRRKRKRLVRDARTLVRYVVLAMLVFTGYTELPHLPFLQHSLFLQILAVGLWFATSYFLSWHIARFLTRTS